MPTALITGAGGGIGSAIAAALRVRGMGEPAASLTAQSGMTVFHVAFGRWIAADNTREFTQLVDESLAALNSVIAEA